MPGVGVAPFGSGLPISFGSGIPGVGVAPFGTLLAFTVLGSGMPGVALPEGVTVLPENSGGTFAELVELVFAFGDSVEVQATVAPNARHIKINKKFLNIISSFLYFKIAVPA